jgi:acyl CoA:acetate/3-ketoacid CoA transferase
VELLRLKNRRGPSPYGRQDDSVGGERICQDDQFIVNKVIDSFEAAIADIQDGATIMLGGFGLCGIPENLIEALVAKKIRGLHTISNNVGVDGFGTGLMLEAGMIASHIGSYVGENKLLEEMVIGGRVSLTLVPQGTLSERIRAGGAGTCADGGLRANQGVEGRSAG